MLSSAEAADAAATQLPKRAFTAPSAIGRTSTYAMSASQQPSEEPQADPLDEEEELEDLPAAEKKEDPLLGVHLRREVEGVIFEAVVEDIEVGKISKERLYRIKYADGDLEHLTQQQVEECRIPKDTSNDGQALLEDEAENDDEEEDEDENEGSPLVPVTKKPAARSAPGVQATIAKKPAAAKAGPVAKKPAGA